MSLEINDQITNCACYYGCKENANPPYKFCSQKCGAGGCEHAVNMLGQNVGRNMCRCDQCPCAQYTNSSGEVGDYCDMKCKLGQCGHSGKRW